MGIVNTLCIGFGLYWNAYINELWHKTNPGKGFTDLTYCDEHIFSEILFLRSKKYEYDFIKKKENKDVAYTLYYGLLLTII